MGGPSHVDRQERRDFFEQEALPHLNRLYALALRLVRNPDDARDLVQETMLRAYRFFDQYTAGTNCRAWLARILYNSFNNGYRRAQLEQAVLLSEAADRRLEEAGGAPGGEGGRALPTPYGRLDHHDIEQALDALAGEFREAILLVDIQELRYEEAARVLGVPVGTVKSRVSRGRAMMRRALLPKLQ